mmetsp:Transcript_8194/g.9538  ORF Transcript_8194/g.9538 Transcript_8194/m.9538 type:complete len:344 (-) Transcript_8194:146-1177(-)
MLTFLLVLQKHYSSRQLLLSLFLVLLLSRSVISNDDGQREQTCNNDGNSDGTCFIDPPLDAKYAGESKSYFPSNYFLPVPVRAIRQETHDTKILTFGLPKSRTLGIPISSAILMSVPPPTSTTTKSKAMMRPYNPIHIEQQGSFELLIKIYPDGIAGQYVDSLQVGDMVNFKQTKTNIKKPPLQYPFPKGVSQITMLAGGTGIAPMYQALVPLLKQNQNQNQHDQEIRLLYGNKTPHDILLKKELDELAKIYPNRFTVTYIVGDDAHDTRQYANSMYDVVTGWIDSEKIQQLGFPPTTGNSSIVWVCGVDAMYTSLAGSRMKSLTEDSILYKLGYRDETVWRS